MGMGKSILTAVISAVATLAIAAGAWFSWQHYADQDKAEQLRDVTLQVKNSMQHTFDSNSETNKLNVKVTEVELIRLSDVKYDGMATVSSSSSPEHQVKIDVTADDEHMMWVAAPGALAFLITDTFKNKSSPAPSSLIPGGDLASSAVN